MKVRGFRYCEGIVYVPLSQGLEAKIDLQDVENVSGRNWCAHKIRRTIYAMTNVPFSKANGRHQIAHMHRFIMQPPEGIEVDHINRDGLDNRRCNLRLASTAENIRNSARSRRNTSGFKGVSFDKSTGRWKACIVVAKRKVFLGRHDTPEAAHAAYAEASQRLHGGFGRLA